mmetsp:Transcript_11765/g.13994  ORF Transcript_11765/g.13994 Transcript_11765/m.13994 type:complete len:547 (-) Transcript_11765:270-1910(-)|eukprot:CAMPEP_0197843336 /NCGR_PEP_ID=MMETSP1438-20131217/182_1 /TAXON_ID=1461541 /ORGANISM="Pterosperma sp., Strain CCMP1384" /LENGTH=546 /DNA_ID=CAMNT_0043453419 /DNA_START=104 /DNA_END=1744 /DNA_ORIENTATION=+
MAMAKVYAVVFAMALVAPGLAQEPPHEEVDLLAHEDSILIPVEDMFKDVVREADGAGFKFADAVRQVMNNMVEEIPEELPEGAGAVKEAVDIQPSVVEPLESALNVVEQPMTIEFSQELPAGAEEQMVQALGGLIDTLFSQDGLVNDAVGAIDLSSMPIQQMQGSMPQMIEIGSMPDIIDVGSMPEMIDIGSFPQMIDIGSMPEVQVIELDGSAGDVEQALLREVLGRRFGPFADAEVMDGPRGLESFFSPSDFFPAAFTTFPVQLFPANFGNFIADFAPMPFVDQTGIIVDSMDQMDCDGMDDVEIEIVADPQYYEIPLEATLEVDMPDMSSMLSGPIEIIYDAPLEVGEGTPEVVLSDLVSMLDGMISSFPSDGMVIEVPVMEEAPVDMYFEVGGDIPDAVWNEQAPEDNVMFLVEGDSAEAMPIMQGSGELLTFLEPQSGEEVYTFQLTASELRQIRTEFICILVGLCAFIGTLVHCCCSARPSDDEEEEPMYVNVVDVNAYTPLMTADVPETTEELHFLPVASPEGKKMQPMDFENPIAAKA